MACLEMEDWLVENFQLAIQQIQWSERYVNREGAESQPKHSFSFPYLHDHSSVLLIETWSRLVRDS